jgi:phytol kinase
VSAAGFDLARELLAAGAVGAVYLLVFAAAELWRYWRRPPVEWTRKAVHMAGGLVALGFPWLFQSPITVLALAAAFALLLWGTRRLGWLQSVHGVERKSEGGLYYPLAIFLLFALGRGQPVFYLVSLLALVLADALAAVLGASYGRLTYSVEDDRRSIEGSAVFFLVTFLGAHLPLLLLTPIGRLESVLVAAQLALLVTLLEAVSLRGNDNLLVKMTPKPAEVLAFQLASQLVILAVLVWVSWRSRLLTLSGTLAASLFFYGAFSLGGEEWTIAPAAALLVFLAVFRGAFAAAPSGSAPDRRYQVLAVFYSCAAAAALVLANNTF